MTRNAHDKIAAGLDDALEIARGGRRRAKGTESPDGRSRAIAIRFEPEIFAEIAGDAERNEVSFAEQVRIFIGRGMDKIGGGA